LKQHPFELLQVGFPVTPWIDRPKKSVYDVHRAHDYLYGLSPNQDTDVIRGYLRDWNEEYQSFKAMPKTTIQERIKRDQAIIKTNCEFVEATTRAAVSIVNKSVMPINPPDPESHHLHIIDNIFLSKAVDIRELFKDCGGDATAYKVTNNDVRAISAYNDLEIEGLHSILTAIVDYKGHRIVGQSIIPGILQRNQAAVVYGSVDFGKTITMDEEFHKLMLTVAKKFNLTEHTIMDTEGKKI